MRTSKRNVKCYNCKRRHDNCHSGCDDFETPTYSNDFSNSDMGDYMRQKTMRLKKIINK